MRFLCSAKLFVAFALGVACGTPAQAQRVIWSEFESGRIRDAALDGTNSRTLISASSRPTGLAVDAAARQLYWVDQQQIGFTRANLDGTNPVHVDLTGSEDPYAFHSAWSIALYPAGATSGGTPSILVGENQSDVIRRTRFDGTASIPFVTGLDDGDVYAIALVPAASRIYYTLDNGDGSAQGIFVADMLTGSTFLHFTDQQTRGVAFDPVAEKVYWAGFNPDAPGTPAILRMNGDGTNIQPFLPLDSFEIGVLAVNPTERMLYFENLGSLWRASIEGGATELIAANTGRIGGIAFAPVPEPTSLLIATFACVGAFAVGGSVNAK